MGPFDVAILNSGLHPATGRLTENGEARAKVRPSQQRKDMKIYIGVGLLSGWFWHHLWRDWGIGARFLLLFLGDVFFMA